jgi:flagellar assembly protein FliH
MPKISLTLPRRLNRVEILKAENIKEDQYPAFIYDGEIINESPDGRDLDGISGREKRLSRKPVFYEEFSFSDMDTPIEISLKKIPDETLSLEEVKKEVQAGYDRGFEDGQMILRGTMEAEILKQQEWIRRIDKVIEDLEKHYYKEVEDFEDAVVRIAVMIAGQILEREATVDSNIVVEQARKAVRTLNDDVIFKIRVHPENLDILQKVKSRLISDSSRIKNVEITSDDSIDRLGCIMETSAGIIDARLKTQLERVRNTLENVSMQTPESIAEEIS